MEELALESVTAIFIVEQGTTGRVAQRRFGAIWSDTSLDLIVMTMESTGVCYF